MQQTQTPSTAPEDDFVNLADLIRIIWRRRCAILTVTLLSALVTATYVLLKPRPYTAVAMMEVVPEYSREGQVDKGFFETRVLTHLEIADLPCSGCKC